MRRRFVVLRHTRAPQPIHYDLMIEAGGALVTFQLKAPPGREAVHGQRSFDHRLRYLDYEGALSRGRGFVEAWDRGELWDEEGEPRGALYRARFAGSQLIGSYRILAEAGREEVRFDRFDPQRS